MPLHIIKLVNKRELARDTFLFEFAKPQGFHFIPGQYGGFTLINPSETDAKGNTRRFSLLNAPQDDTLQIATRIQNSAYKRSLHALPIGAEIKFAGASGNFVLHEDHTVPAVFIAGGIGITPFYSIIRAAGLSHSTAQMQLFYGNQSPDNSILIQELQQLENANTNFKLIPTFATPEQDWHGETGYITHTMLKKYISDLHIPNYYVCGSPMMVKALQELLLEMGIPQEKIKVEDFPGY